MNGLDTNLLIRYVTQDDPIQSPKATEIIEGRLTRERSGFISLVTMAETVWVLGSVYGLADGRSPMLWSACCRPIRWWFKTNSRCTRRW